jgi:YtkA-like protein
MRKCRFLLFLMLLIVAGCRQQTPTPNADFNIMLAVEPDPLVVGDATLVITVTDPSGAAVNDAKIAVRGDMNHAGMTPVFAEIDGGTNGQYRVPFQWTMAGDWIVEVTVTLANGEKVVKSFDAVVNTSQNMPEMTMESGG